MRPLLGLLCCGALLAGCGGVSDAARGVSTGSGVQLSAPVIIKVAPGTTTSDVNIVVPPATGPASNAPNAEILGVGSTAQVTGAAVSRGTINDAVFLCGPGLSGNMDVYVGGSNFGSTVNDVVVRNIAAVSCEGGAASSGIAFAVSASPNATPGARSIYLHSANGDIATFTGGLEVIP